MSLFKVFDVAGSAMNAQSVRMNVTASNLANAGSVSGDADKVYRARHPVFATFGNALANETGVAGVRLQGVIESQAPLQVQHRPDHPDADENGNIFVSNVNTVEEMVNMISASRSYQNNVEMINTTKDLLLQTLSLGR
ncbi:MAG: flagellar basal body rod protein FlgC [Gammaproteobacteria bacterium]|nr:flagellar basal body rod protein FlgC [Gammaproteobacteria bacterium]